MKKIYLYILFLVSLILFLILIFDDMFISFKETKSEYLNYQESLNSFVVFISSQKVYKDKVNLTINLDDNINQIEMNDCLQKSATKEDCSVYEKKIYNEILHKLRESGFKKIVLEEKDVVFYLDSDGLFSVQHYSFYYSRNGPIKDFILSCFQERVLDNNWYYKYENGEECDG